MRTSSNHRGHVAIAAFAVLTAVASLLIASNLYAQTLHDAKSVFGDYDRDIANLRRSIDMFDRIIRESRDPDVQYGAYWMKSRAYSTMGDHPALTGTDALKDYEAGKAAAAEAIKINRNGEKGYFWYAVNLGKVGRLKGVLHALFMLPEFERYMERAYALQPDDPWVLVAYGALYYELPWIVGGSDSRALGYLKRALDVSPDFTVSMVLMGRVYIKEGAYDKARSVLERVVHCKAPASRADWAMSDSPAAQELLHRIDTMQRAGRQGGGPSVQEAPSFFTPFLECPALLVQGERERSELHLPQGLTPCGQVTGFTYIFGRTT